MLLDNRKNHVFSLVSFTEENVKFTAAQILPSAR